MAWGPSPAGGFAPRRQRDDAPGLIALDGKISRRSHDRAAGKPPLHLVSAFATAEGLVLGREAVAKKSNEITAIPLLLERPAEAGALVIIDTIARNPAISSRPPTTEQAGKAAPTALVR